jgi:hypothetical protein
MPIPGDTTPPKFATGTDADDGDYTTALVAAVTGRKIRVLSLTASVLTTAGVFSLKSASTTIFQAHLALGVPLIVGMAGVPVCETATGEALVASNATGVDSFVNITYTEVTP